MAVAAPGTASLTWRPRDSDRGRGYTAGMIKRIAFATFLLCILAACGNKGPLVMPSPAPATETPAPDKAGDVGETPVGSETDSGTPARS